METVFIFLPVGTRTEDLSRVAAHVGEIFALQDAEGFTVETPGGYTAGGTSYARVEEEHLGEWSDDDLEESLASIELARAELGEPIVFSVHYWDIAWAKRILEQFLTALPAVVDNDFGFVGTGSAFLQRLHADPDWDWRLNRA